MQHFSVATVLLRESHTNLTINLVPACQCPWPCNWITPSCIKAVFCSDQVSESIDWSGFYFLESKKLSIIVYRLHIGIIVS